MKAGQPELNAPCVLALDQPRRRAAIIGAQDSGRGMTRLRIWTAALIAAAVAGSPALAAGGGQADVDGARIRAADREPQSWMAVGRTYDEQRFSPLTGINTSNVSRLGLAWYADLNTYRG